MALTRRPLLPSSSYHGVGHHNFINDFGARTFTSTGYGPCPSVPTFRPCDLSHARKISVPTCGLRFGRVGFHGFPWFPLDEFRLILAHGRSFKRWSCGRPRRAT